MRPRTTGAPPPPIHPYYPPAAATPGDDSWEAWVLMEALVRCIAEHLAVPQPCAAHRDAARQVAAARFAQRHPTR